MSDSHPTNNYAQETMDPHAAIGRSITVESQRKDLNTIFLKLRIADSTGFYDLILLSYHCIVNPALLYPFFLLMQVMPKTSTSLLILKLTLQSVLQPRWSCSWI